MQFLKYIITFFFFKQNKSHINCNLRAIFSLSPFSFSL